MKTLNLRLVALCLFILAFTVTGYSQSKYGNVSMDEMTMTSYPQDSTAAAVILSKNGETRFKYSDLDGFQYEYTLQIKIKILKTEGLDWCNQSIRYYESSNVMKEDITNLSGTTYNLENGKIEKTKLSKEYIFDEEAEEKYKVKKFTMPAAKVGSVIEYKYTIVSDFYYDLADFNFQESIPIAYVSFEALLPEYFRYNVNFQGYERIDTKKEPANETFYIKYRDDNGRMVNESVRCTAVNYTCKGVNIPSLKRENYLWNINDYISKATFELQSVNMPYQMTKSYSSTWENIDKEIFESSRFGGNLKKADLFKNEVSKSEASIARAREIQNMIKSKVQWNEKVKFYPTNLKDVLKSGMGSNADMNFLLINALQAGGIEAFPVILSTRENGRIPLTHPSLTSFNYVITGIKIDTLLYFTDASAKYGDWNLLPDRAMVTQARILKQGGKSDWVDLSTLSNGMIYKVGQFKFVDSRYEGQISDSRKGNSAEAFKDKYESYKDKNEYTEQLAKQMSSEIENLEISNLDDTNQPVKIGYTQKTNIELGSEYIYLTPLIESPFSENPFKSETRVLPINFDYLLGYIQIIDIQIPDGYAVEELPKSEKIVLNDNDMSLTYRITQQDSNIKVHYQFSIKKLIFLPTEYETLKNFFGKLISKGSEQVVLKKTASI